MNLYHGLALRVAFRSPLFQNLQFILIREEIMENCGCLPQFRQGKIVRYFIARLHYIAAVTQMIFRPRANFTAPKFNLVYKQVSFHSESWG